MSLMRRRSTSSWNPFRELEEMMDRMSRLAPTSGSSPEREHLAIADWSPSVNIQENDDAYVVEAHLPRVNKEDVHVSVEEGATVKNAVVRDSIVFAEGMVENAVLTDSVVGRHAVVNQGADSLNVGDHSQMNVELRS